MSKELIAKLRYMGRQYSAGQQARGGAASKHYLEEAADRVEALEAELAALRAPVEQAPEGWKLVPIEPTWEMICAMHEAERKAADVYRAAIGAAPSAPGRGE